MTLPAGAERSTALAPGWTVEVRRDERALAGLAEEWQDLYARSPAATPFQSYPWLTSWWAAHGTPGRLRLFLVRDRGRLAAAAPLMLTRHWGCPVLMPLAAPQGDFTDVLLDPASPDDAARPDAARPDAARPVTARPDATPPGAARAPAARAKAARQDSPSRRPSVPPPAVPPPAASPDDAPPAAAPPPPAPPADGPGVGPMAEGALPQLIRALLAERGWAALDFPEVRPGSAAHALLAQWPGRAWRLPASVCPDPPAGGPGGFPGPPPPRSGGTARTGLRAGDARELAVATVPADRAAPAITALLDLRAEQGRRPIGPGHAQDRFRRQLTGAVAAMIEDGQAEIVEYRLDGRLVASDLVLIGHGFVGAYLYGSAPALRDGADVPLLLLRDILDAGGRRGLPEAGPRRGDEPGAAAWRPIPVASDRLILGRSATARLYTGLVRTRGRLAAARRVHRNREGQ